MCNFRQENPRVVLPENSPVKIYCEIYSLEIQPLGYEHLFFSRILRILTL